MSEKIDLLLIKANNQKRLYQGLSQSLSGLEPPLWLVLTAAFIRERGGSVAVIDAEVENLSPQETAQRAVALNPLLLGIIVSGTNPSASTTNMPGANETFARIRELNPQIPKIISGLHPSALPEVTLGEDMADFVIVGEGFSAFWELLHAFKTGKNKGDDFDIKGLWYKKDGNIIAHGRTQNIPDLGTLPMPAWDLLPMDKYRAHNWHAFDDIDRRQPYGVIYTSLGCPFNCTFCCINSPFGGAGIRYRPPVKVAQEIDHLVKTYRIRHIKIIDEMFALNPSHVFELCERIASLGHDLNFWVYGRIDTIRQEMLSKMKKAGINWLAYGIESGSKKVREGVSKGRFGQERIKEVVKMTHEAGIHIVANFIFGLPEDDFETMRETLALAKELNCEYANFYCTMAYPGSELYRQAVAKDIPLPPSWEGYAQFSEETYPLPTKYLSSGEVLSFRDMAFEDYYNDPKYLNMIEQKFGSKTVEHIRGMCSVRLKRKYAVPLKEDKFGLKFNGGRI